MAISRIQTLVLDDLITLGFIEAAVKNHYADEVASLGFEDFAVQLTEKHGVSEVALMLSKGRAMNAPYFHVPRAHLVPTTFALVNRDICQANQFLPIGKLAGQHLIVMANPFDSAAIAKLHELLGSNVFLFLGKESDIEEKLKKNPSEREAIEFGDVAAQLGLEPEEDDDQAGDESEESAPIITLANKIIEDAYFLGASDIHIDPWEKEVVIRYRIDGLTHEKLRIPGRANGALVARLKIMCNLDISERRLPQDGRIVFKHFNRKGIDLDLRVSTAPLNHGEGVVMRILDKQKSTLPLTSLGFSEENLSRYRDAVRQPYGMILHCGPTGSGKSMTLYSALGEINTPDMVIRTAEDPIEYTLPGVNQMQMHKQIGLTFATALRAFLRQDPDIILVGEIRDKETANIAVEAALTGHLLISTLHTNDAPSTIARLTDMGVEPFMISSSLVCVCAQRLLRRVCKSCRQQYMPEAREAELLNNALGWSGPIFMAKPGGCQKCGGNGYKGRVGIHELMTTSEDLVSAINQGKDVAVLKQLACANGMKTLHQDSLLKVKEGLTTMAEAISTVPPDI